MKLPVPLITLAALALSSLATAEEGFTPIFDGKTLQGWTAARSSGPGDYGAFSVNEEEQAIHVYAGKAAGSKQKTDCLVTEAKFSHFVLKLEYQWLEKRFAPRADWERDAGLLFHVHGDLKRVWPFSIEMQIGESPIEVEGSKRFHTGDLFVLGKNLRATTLMTGSFYDLEGNATTTRKAWTNLGKEKPKGEWNEMEIRVHGGESATYIFNGEEVFKLTKIEQKSKNGQFRPLDNGRIGLQAEYAELLYRNIRIKELLRQPDTEE